MFYEIVFVLSFFNNEWVYGDECFRLYFYVEFRVEDLGFVLLYLM